MLVHAGACVAYFLLWKFISIMLLSYLWQGMQVRHQKFVNGPRCFENNYACWVNLQTDDQVCPGTREHFATYIYIYIYALNSFRWFEVHQCMISIVGDPESAYLVNFLWGWWWSDFLAHVSSSFQEKKLNCRGKSAGIFKTAFTNCLCHVIYQ